MIYLKLNDTLVKTNCERTAQELEKQGFTRIQAWKEEAKRILKKTFAILVAQTIGYLLLRYVFAQEVSWVVFAVVTAAIILCYSWVEDWVT